MRPERFSETWWTDLRWRIGTRFILVGTKITPPGDARDAMITAFLGWSKEAARQWQRRIEGQAKQTEKAG